MPPNGIVYENDVFVNVDIPEGKLRKNNFNYLLKKNITNFEKTTKVLGILQRALRQTLESVCVCCF